MSTNVSVEALPRAFVLTGSFLAICRAPAYFAELSARDLRILLVTPAGSRADAARCLAEDGHPVHAVDDIAFVDGSVDREGSFTGGVIAAVRGWRERYTIVGTYAVGETLVEPTGLVADALGVPTPGLRATRVCRSKYLQRWYLPEFSPRSLVVPVGQRSSVDLTGVTFPAVVKPATRHSSSGVVTVRDADRLAAALGEYAEHEVVLVEERVLGAEYSVESLVQHGKIIFASVTAKTTTESGADTFVELSHSVPFDRLPGVRDVLLDANDRMLRSLRFGDGIAHAEWRVDGRGRPMLMEVAARTPGDGLAVLYRLATGESLESTIMRIALGEHADYPSPCRYTRQVYLEHPVGTLADVVVEWPGIEPAWVGETGLWPDVEPGATDDPPTLRAVFVFADVGRELVRPRSSEDRVVAFFIDAPTQSELDRLEALVRRAIRIETLP